MNKKYRKGFENQQKDFDFRNKKEPLSLDNDLKGDIVGRCLCNVQYTQCVPLRMFLRKCPFLWHTVGWPQEGRAFYVQAVGNFIEFQLSWWFNFLLYFRSYLVLWLDVELLHHLDSEPDGILIVAGHHYTNSLWRNSLVHDKISNCFETEQKNHCQ